MWPEMSPSPSLSHSLPRLLSQEVEMMNLRSPVPLTSVMFPMWLWSSGRHQNGGGRHESTNILSGLPVDLNGRSWVPLVSTKIKNRKREAYLNWNFCGREDFRHTWVKALKQCTVSSPFRASFSSELCHIIVSQFHLWGQSRSRKHVKT